jgi:hypothetical protein
MKTKLVSCLLAAFAIAGLAAYCPPADRTAETAAVDFVSLHDQAASALQTLQVSQQRRMAMQKVSEAAF